MNQDSQKEAATRISPYPSTGSAEPDLPECLGLYVSHALENVYRSHLIDNVNFNGEVFPHVIDPRRVFDLYPLEPGYTMLDAAFEIGAAVRHLEATRLATADPERGATFRRWMEEAGVGVSNCGCTGVIHQIIEALLSLPKDEFPRQNAAPEVVVPLPGYSVFPIQMGHFRERLKVHWVISRRQDDFLPTFDDIRSAVTDRTIAVMLTYPGNPSMATYTGARLDDLRSIVRFCQEQGLFLVVDNIFQDMLYLDAGHRFEEVFLHADGLEGIVKIYGPSKDVPFFCGYRMGYWIGDPRLVAGFRTASGTLNNGVNTLSLVLFSLHLYFRSLRLTGDEPSLQDGELFADAVFGSTSKINKVCEVSGDHRKLFQPQVFLDKLVELDLYGAYRRGMEATEKILGDALRRLMEFVTASKAFSDWVNHGIGNVFFLRVDPEIFPGDDDQFFHFALDEACVGILPGSGFGLERKAGQAWFRMTTAHAPIEEILADLKRLEHALLRRASGA